MGNVPIVWAGDFLDAPHETFVIVTSVEPIVPPPYFGFRTYGCCVSLSTGSRYMYRAGERSDMPFSVGDASARFRPYQPTDSDALIGFFGKLKKAQAVDSEEGREIVVALDAIERKLTKRPEKVEMWDKSTCASVADDLQKLFSNHYPMCFNQ